MEVINIANEIYGKNTPWHGVQRQRLLLLAERLVAAEREACAKVCDAMSDKHGWEGSYAAECATTIRARGDAK
jgi:hypothetical protein